MKRLPPSQIIADYRAAYERANGKDCPCIEYERGWFLMRDLILYRFRGAQLIHMTAQLNERAKAKG